MNEQLTKMIRQNETIIALLGRMAFDRETIRRIVSRNKRNPAGYVNGYNNCDGNHTLSEIADIVGVSIGTLSPILSEWEEIGIIYEVEKPGGKYYKKIFSI